jgi:hypothetical protein
MVDDMVNKRFRLSSDCIVLINGKLANGQHRLWAVVESNLAQPFILMRTDDEELYKVLDCGKPRSVSDVVRIPVSGQCSAAASLALGYQRKTLTLLGFKKRNSRVEQIEFVEKNSVELLAAVQLAARLTSNHLNLIAKSATAAFQFLCEPRHGERSEAFLNHVYTGDLPESITFVLRERFTKHRMEVKGAMPAQAGLALLIKSFNMHYTGAKFNRYGLRLEDGEAFPEICQPTQPAAN